MYGMGMKLLGRGEDREIHRNRVGVGKIPGDVNNYFTLICNT